MNESFSLSCELLFASFLLRDASSFFEFQSGMVNLSILSVSSIKIIRWQIFKLLFELSASRVQGRQL